MKYIPKYWNRKGRFQKRYLALWGALIPSEGECPTTHGEILRWASKMMHDIYNNGGCNMKDMDFRQSLLKASWEVFFPFAKKLRVKDFRDKLNRFVGVRGTDRENDEVMDVIVCYVWDLYQRTVKETQAVRKLLNNAHGVLEILKHCPPNFSDVPALASFNRMTADLQKSIGEVEQHLDKVGMKKVA